MTSKTTESRPVNRAIANTYIQTKLNVNRPGDRYEAEADRAAAAVVSQIEGRTSNTHSGPAGVQVSRLQSDSSATQRQCCEEEEMQTKLQRQPMEEEEEMQTKLQRQPMEEEEEMQTKLQRQPMEEEEEMQTKLQRQPMEEEEEMQTKLQRQPMEEEEEMQTKLQRRPMEEEEEMQTKLQRQPMEEEEEMQMKEDGASGSGQPGNSQNHVESRIDQRRGQGNTLEGNVKGEMETGFGADFSSVRVHNDTEASQISSDLNAQAFTTGNDIYFNAGKYQPESGSGKTLLAHELTHVIQQKGKTGEVARKTAAGKLVEEQPVRDTSGKISQKIHISGNTETEIQREVGDIPEIDPADVSAPTDNGPADAGSGSESGDAGSTGDAGDSGDAAPSDEGGETPAPAAPTLNLTPGNTLTRGDTLKATIMFQPNGGESYRVTSWQFTTAEHGNVDRASSDAEFQNKWDGTMAVSGTLEMTYRITPDGGSEGPESTLSEEITVEDRTGDMWESEVDEQEEVAYSEAPSPPTRFPHLGHHSANVEKPDPDLETITGGPNKTFRFVKELEAGNYPSSPKIHPDLLDDTSDFYTFHLNAGILYIVKGENQTEVPRSEYSNLVIGESSIEFDVPDWDTFLKAHDMLRVTATAEDDDENTFVVPESAWALDSNSRDARVGITDEPAVRTGLGIDQNEGFDVDVEGLGSYSAQKLMQAPAILAGTRSHEYAHNTHSHRANFVKMIRALDPEKKIEDKVSAPGHAVNFNSLLTTWRSEIMEAVPTHDLVDEAESEELEEFVALAGQTMAGINTDPDTDENLGAVWNISSNSAMGN